MGENPANSSQSSRSGRWFHLLAPGILIAATGVGAGDLITASLAGSAVGVAIVWAAVVGGVFKWVLNEGIARWQLATGTTLLEGWVARLGRWVQWVFIIYLIVWTFVTGGALVSACGVAGAGLCDLGLPLAKAKVVWGVVHSLVGLVLVWFGGFRLFEKLMSICIGVMFCTVIATALLARPDWNALVGGVFKPSIPSGALPWVLGLLGGVGGSVTLLSYGYWIREVGRAGHEGVRACRIDLAVGYAMTALFGVAMVTIGSRLMLAKGDAVAIELARQLELTLGPAGIWGRWVFLVGFWGAVFSSMLGVWQSIPYLFADFVLIRRGVAASARAGLDYTRTRPYRVYLLAIAVIPLLLLGRELKQVQLTYAIMAALFMPFLALTLLIMNNRTRWVGERFRSRWPVNFVLLVTMAFFAYVGFRSLVSLLS